MKAPSVTILDVIDNYSIVEHTGDIAALPGKNLKEFGEEVRRYTQAYEVPPLDRSQHPIYLGGWPSANFGTVAGQMLLSSLLYSGQIVIKDPLADWFCEEQYFVEHRLSARPGYRREDGSLEIGQTRAFLRHALAALEELRPLITAGIVVLAPAEPLFKREEASISALREDLTNRFATDPTKYLQRFSPSDVPVEDNRRGMFVWAGGEKQQQYWDAISYGMLYFAREYLLATSAGATYTAPFPHEQFVARHGLSPASTSPSDHVIEALFHSQLPVFQGLTPTVIAQLHDDDAFAAFRADLHTVYQHIPAGADDSEVTEYVRDQEDALLRPHVSAAEKAADAGLLGRVKGRLRGAGFSLAAGLVVDLTSATPLAGGLTAAAVNIAQTVRDNKKDGSPQVIWNALVRHNRAVSQELTGVQEVQPSTPTADPWSIPDEPSMSVTVSPGEVLFDSPHSATGPPATVESGRVVYGSW